MIRVTVCVEEPRGTGQAIGRASEDNAATIHEALRLCLQALGAAGYAPESVMDALCDLANEELTP